MKRLGITLILAALMLVACADPAVDRGLKYLNDYRETPKGEPADPALLDRAADQFQQAIDRNPKDKVALLNMGLTKREKGDLDGAIADYDKAIEIDEDYAKAWNNRGVAYMTKGDKDTALASFREATDCEDKIPSAHFNRARLEFEHAKDNQTALHHADEAIKLDDDKGPYYALRAQIHDAMGSADLAAADRAKAEELGNNLD